MSEGWIEPADADNTDPRCNMQTGTTYGADNRCGSTPETAYPGAEEVGL